MRQPREAISASRCTLVRSWAAETLSTTLHTLSPMWLMQRRNFAADDTECPRSIESTSSYFHSSTSRKQTCLEMASNDFELDCYPLLVIASLRLLRRCKKNCFSISQICAGLSVNKVLTLRWSVLLLIGGIVNNVGIHASQRHILNVIEIINTSFKCGGSRQTLFCSPLKLTHLSSC